MTGAGAGERLTTAVRGFAARVEQVQPGDTERPTPCTDWDVRALVEHVAGELLWMSPLLAGRTIAEVGDTLDGDHLGSDVAAGAATAMSAAQDAVVGVTDWSAPVHVSYGDVPAHDYVDEVATDVLVHTWDLARALGADEQLDADLVQRALDRVDGAQEALAASGMFGAPVAVAADATPQARLLAALGRTQ